MADVLAYLDRHPALVGVVVYVLGSALINWIARLESPEAWEQLKREVQALDVVIGGDPATVEQLQAAVKLLILKPGFTRG